MAKVAQHGGSFDQQNVFGFYVLVRVAEAVHVAQAVQNVQPDARKIQRVVVHNGGKQIFVAPLHRETLAVMQRVNRVQTHNVAVALAGLQRLDFVV